MSEIIDNSISQYAKLHNIPMYEVSDLRGTIIVLKNETDYLTLLKKYNVGALFFSYSVTDDSDEIDADIDYEEVQHQLEEDYKFLPVFADLLSADEYISRLDGIIDKHLDKNDEDPTYKEIELEYTFFVDSIGYAFIYYRAIGSKREDSTLWTRLYKLRRECESDILNWGTEFAQSVYAEKEALTNELRNDDDFFKCKTKDARTMYLEEFVNLHYPHLRELMNHPNSFKKIPDFYFSFDRSRRSFYASQIFDSINKSK